jgi:hypothetical protein
MTISKLVKILEPQVDIRDRADLRAMLQQLQEKQPNDFRILRSAVEGLHSVNKELSSTAV